MRPDSGVRPVWLGRRENAWRPPWRRPWAGAESVPGSGHAGRRTVPVLAPDKVRAARVGNDWIELNGYSGSQMLVRPDPVADLGQILEVLVGVGRGLSSEHGLEAGGAEVERQQARG